MPLIESPRRTDSRHRDRHVRAAATSLTNIAGRMITVFTSLATIPAALAHLGQERFGLWMTVTSLTALLSFADLGLGNGLLGVVAEANGREESARIRASASNAFAMLCGVALLVLAVSLVVVPEVDWRHLFGVSTDVASREVPVSMWVFAVCFAVSIPASVVGKVQMGLQQGYLAGAWQAAGSLVGLAGVLAAIWAGLGLPWLIAALLGGPLAAAILNFIVFFVMARPDLRPSPSLVTWDVAQGLLRTGVLFFVLQVAVSLAFASDNLILARILGVQSVTDFAITAKIFGIVSVLISMLLQPLWPAYGEAIARRDIDWVRRTFSRATLGAVVVAMLLVASLLVIFGPLTKVWLHRELIVPWQLLVGFAVWMVVEALGNSLSMFLNGARVVGLQVVLASAFAVVCVLLKFIAASRFGVSGLPWATIVAYTTVSLLPSALALKTIMNKL